MPWEIVIISYAENLKESQQAVESETISKAAAPDMCFSKSDPWVTYIKTTSAVD